MVDIVLINPRFDISFWGLELALPFMRKRAGMPPACLPLLAAPPLLGRDAYSYNANGELIEERGEPRTKDTQFLRRIIEVLSETQRMVYRNSAGIAAC